jgi:glycosyltransferase involved in cell wall biosynthesis
MVISIITINYNNAKGLKRTIESVINQNYKNIEYIIIDGGSTDESTKIINVYQNKIAFSISEKDNGVFDAQNKGIQKATGDYILVLNSGDELDNFNVLESIFNTTHTEDIIYGNMMIVYENNRREYGKMPKMINFEHMMNDTLWHPVSFVKKDFLNQVGLYDTSYNIVADYEWFLRAIFKFHAILKYYDMPISVFYLGGLSSHIDNVESIKLERLNAQISNFGEEKVNEFNKMKSESKPKITLINRVINWFNNYFL